MPSPNTRRRKPQPPEPWDGSGCPCCLDPNDLPDPFERIREALEALPSRSMALAVDGQPGLSGFGGVYCTDAPHLVRHLEGIL